MGWNTACVMIEDRSRDELLNLLPDVFGYTPTGHMVPFDVASTSHGLPNMACARVGEWQVLWEPAMRFVPRIERLLADIYAKQVASGTRTLAVTFSSVTSIYAFWYFEGTELTRAAAFESGAIVRSDGEPLDCEASAPIPSWGHDEDFLFHVIAHLTGCRLEDMEGAAWEAVSMEL